MERNEKKQLILEFLRYALVGGAAFVVDTGVMTVAKELLFKENCTSLQMAICVAFGFFAGLIANYLLSNWFVFRSEQQKKDGKGFRAVFLYALVGVTGFCLTELGMYVGVSAVGSDGLWYILIKCFVAGVVLIWNYIGRKIFVYHGR